MFGSTAQATGAFTLVGCVAGVIALLLALAISGGLLWLAYRASKSVGDVLMMATVGGIILLRTPIWVGMGLAECSHAADPVEWIFGVYLMAWTLVPIALVGVIAGALNSKTME